MANTLTLMDVMPSAADRINVQRAAMQDAEYLRQLREEEMRRNELIRLQQLYETPMESYIRPIESLPPMVAQMPQNTQPIPVPIMGNRSGITQIPGAPIPAAPVPVQGQYLKLPESTPARDFPTMTARNQYADFVRAQYQPQINSATTNKDAGRLRALGQKFVLEGQRMGIPGLVAEGEVMMQATFPAEKEKEQYETTSIKTKADIDALMARVPDSNPNKLFIRSNLERAITQNPNMEIRAQVMQGSMVPTGVVDVQGSKTTVIGGGGIRKDESDLRKEFSALREVKDYKVLSGKYDDMQKIFAKVKDFKSLNPADQVMIMDFNKLLDPNSVVRESEYARTAENMSLLNRAQALASRWTQGGVLNEVERNELLQATNIIKEANRQKYKAARDQYIQIALDYGYEPKRVVPSEERTGDVGKLGPSKTAAPKIGDVKSGYRFKGGDPAKQENWEKVGG